MKDFLKKMLAAIGVTSVKDDLTEDEAIELVKSKTAGASPALPEPLLALLDLDKNATEPQVRGAIMALKSPAGVVPLAEHEALKTKLAVLEIDAAVMAALSDGKLSPAEKDGWLKDLKDGKERLETFAAFTSRRGKVVPLREKLPGQTESLAAALTGSADDQVRKQLGISPETFAKYNAAQN